MKKYIYKDKFFNIRVAFVGYFVIAIFLYAVYNMVVKYTILWFVVALVCVYQFFNTFISISNPKEVDIDDHRITFKGFGKEHTYDFKQIKDFRVKSWPDTHKVYLRINKDETSILKGRYWIDCMYFNDTLELYQFFLDKEYEMHPETIKAYARRSNELSPEEKEKVLQAQKERKKKSIFYKKEEDK